MSDHGSRLRRALAVPVLVASALVAPTIQAGSALAKAGDLDPAFAGDGTVVTEAGERFSEARDVAIQPDGRIVVAGVAADDADSDDQTFLVARYNPNGSLDTTFGGGDGLVRTTFDVRGAAANGVALQTDGRIVVVGWTFVSGGDQAFAVARYTAAGVLDSTFSGDGKVVTVVPGSAEALAVALEPDGRIVAAGVVGDDGFRNFAVVRYTAAGVPDTSFDDDGIVETHMGGSDVAYAVVVAGARIVVAGTNGTDFALAAYTRTGALDPSFSADGKVTTSFADDAEARGLALQADGRLVAAGTDNDQAFALARYNADGTLDTGFAGDGTVRTVLSGDDVAEDVAVQADGRIVVVGASSPTIGSFLAVGPSSAVAVARYTAAGVLDTTFSGDGTLTTNVGPGGDGALAAAIQPDGKIVAVGSSGADVALVRYLTDVVALNLSIGDVTVTEGNAGTTSATFTVSLSAPAGPTPVTANFTTANGSAVAPGDYEAGNGTLVFLPGQSAQSVVVLVRGDTEVEQVENFFVNLLAPSGATLVRAQGVGTIVDDDVAPALAGASVDDVVVLEGDDGTVDAVFTVTVVPPAGPAGATVAYATADGTATAPADYQAAAGTLAFGSGESTKSVTVRVAGDRLDEPTERFTMNLSNPVNVTIEDPQGFGKISDDEILVIDTLAGGPGLVERVVVRGGASGAQVARLCADPAPSPCVDLGALAAGAGPNPRTVEGTTFEAIDAAGLTPATSVVTGAGITAAPVLDIRLGRAVPAVAVTLVQGPGAPASVEAFLTDGTSAGTATRSAAAGVAETLRLPQAPATEVAHQPFGLAVAGTNVLVADPANHLVRFLDRSGAVESCPCLSVLAGNGALGATDDGADPLRTQVAGPYATAVKPLGGGRFEAYVADTFGHRVVRISPQGTGAVATVLAGTGAFGFGGDGGPGPAAVLNSPYGIAVDPLRDVVYVADTLNHRVRAIRSDGTIATVAGTGTAGSSGDGGPGPVALLDSPRGLAVDGAGNLFIADTGNHAVRRLDAVSGLLSRVAGTGTAGFAGDGGPAAAARLLSPAGVAVDGGDVLVADTGNHRIRRVAGGTIATVAGTGSPGFGGDGGPGTAALLDSPFGVAVDTAGEVLVADTGNNRIRRVATGTITTLAGNGSPSYAGTGVPAGLAQLAGAASVATWRASQVVAAGVPTRTFVTDTFSHTVRMVDQSGTITTLAGNGLPGRGGDGGPATAAQLDHPVGVAIDRASPPTAVFVADTMNNVVRRIDLASGVITTVAGGGSGGDGPALSARLGFPTGVALDVAGNLYIAEAYAARVRRVDTAGTMSTVAGTGTLGGSGDGGPGPAAELFMPTSVAADGADPPTLLVADSFNHRVRRVAPDGTIAAFAGNGAQGSGGDGGLAGAGSFDRPFGVGVDPGVGANSSVADTQGHRVRRVDGSGGTLSTIVAVGAAGFGGDLGPAVAALLSGARGIGPVIRDKLAMIGDSFGWRVRRLGPPIHRVTPDPVRFRVTGAAIGCTTACPQQVVTVANVGLATMHIRSAVLGGQHPGDYRVVADRCTDAKLPPGQGCTFRVTFVPTATCPTRRPCRLALVTLSGNASDSFREVDLEGAVDTQKVTIATTATPSGTSVVAGSPASDAATVTGPAGQPVPTGTVSFFLCGPAQVTPAGCPAGGSPVGGPVPLAAGAATSPATTATTAAGTYCWRAAYSGDVLYEPATHTNTLTAAAGGQTPECFTARLAPTVATTATTTPGSTAGVSGNFTVVATDTATVAGPAGQPVPTGTVSFFLCNPAQVTPAGCPAGGTAVGGPVPLVQGAATSPSTTLVVAGATIGVHCWRAVYSGDARYLPASHTNRLTATTAGVTPECFMVGKLTPTIATLSQPAGTVFSGTVTDRATLSGPSGQPVPTGTVTFFVCRPAVPPTTSDPGPPNEVTQEGCPTGGLAVGGPVALVAGVAVSPPFTPVRLGKHCWRAVYSGDTVYNPASHTNALLAAAGGQSPECFDRRSSGSGPILKSSETFLIAGTGP